jgi:hypothetical protein
MRSVLIAALALLGTTSIAAADAPGNTPIQLPDRDEPAAGVPLQDLPPPPIHQKSPELAVALSVGTTAIGYAMMFGGLAGDSKSSADTVMSGGLLAFLGPSTGQWYAGKVGGLGIGARSLALGLGMIAVMRMSVDECSDCGHSDREPDPNTTRDLLITAGALWFGSTLYDFVAAYRQTDGYNERQRARASQVVPTMLPGANNSMVPGMAYSMKF